MTRKIKPVFHMYIESFQNNTNCENEYFSRFARRLDNITIRIIKREQEFKNILKDAKKKKNRKNISMIILLQFLMGILTIMIENIV